MKNRFKIIVFFISVYSFCYGQKPALNGNTYKLWISAEMGAINPCGSYCYYFLKSRSGSQEIILHSLDNKCEDTLKNGTDCYFSQDCVSAFVLESDRLLCKTLGDSSKGFQLFENGVLQILYSETSDALIYRTSSNASDVCILRLSRQSKRKFKDIEDIQLLNNKRFAIFKASNFNGKATISLLDLKTDSIKQIWSGSQSESQIILSSVEIDHSGEHLAFQEKFKGNKNGEARIWTYDMKNKRLTKITNMQIQYSEDSFRISEDDSRLIFNKSGDKLFFRLAKNENIEKADTIAASVDIWNYKDYPLIPRQDLFKKNTYWAVLNLHTMNIKRLEADNDMDLIFSNNGKLSVAKYLISSINEYGMDYWWHSQFNQKLILISTETGKREELPINNKNYIFDETLSPCEKFVLWYDRIENTYYSYDIDSKIIRNISASIPSKLFDEDFSYLSGKTRFGVAGWLEGDKGLIIYDRYDLWLVDLSLKKKPVNLTNAYGSKNDIILSIADESHDKIYKLGDTLLVAGFHRSKKSNGFGFLILKNKGCDFQLENLDPLSYSIPRTIPSDFGVGTPYERISSGFPVKSKDSKSYIFKGMKAEMSPNIFFTKDFHKITRISNIFPEKEYNWLTSELVKYRLSNGKSVQGILYKPENFDSTKKYPVIVHYYLGKSDGLNMYIQPNPSNAVINIPTYVSNGYIVFEPDIYYSKGKLGKGILNSVKAGVDEIKRYSWIDSLKIGIQGQSFGGYATNYLITQMNFAAACSGSGISDMVSAYGQITDGETKGEYGSNPLQFTIEVGQNYLGTTPWDDTKTFIENSPIFFLNKVQTPLLIWHSKKDRAVPFEQGIEMFLNMRRARKVVWLLQYDGDGHSTSGQNAEDLDTRMMQFFNHYLKDLPAPLWMTSGVPSRFKKIRSGLELDSANIIP